MDFKRVPVDFRRERFISITTAGRAHRNRSRQDQLLRGGGFFSSLLGTIAKKALSGAAKGALSSAGNAAKDALLDKGKQVLGLKGKGRGRRAPLPPTVEPSPGPSELSLQHKEDAVLRRERVQALTEPVNTSFAKPKRVMVPYKAGMVKENTKGLKKQAKALREVGESAGEGLYRPGGRGLYR